MSAAEPYDAPALPLPMFPLGTVLFPHLPLALRAFEPRYRALVRDCLAHGREFGVVLIERGFEVGGGDTRFRVGTAAHIAEEAELPDGQWLLGARGRHRFRVHTWLPDDPYPLALVQRLDDPELGPEGEALLAEAERPVRRALALAAELGAEAAYPASVELSEHPEVAAWQLCGIAPLGPLDRQAILEESDPRVRLRRLITLAEDACDVLAYRMGGPRSESS